MDLFILDLSGIMVNSLKFQNKTVFGNFRIVDNITPLPSP